MRKDAPLPAPHEITVKSLNRLIGLPDCPALVDRDARFLFVAPDQVSAVADAYKAINFDAADAHFTHAGDRCTCDAMLDAFALRTPALDRMARIIRAADTDRLSDAPQAAGLLAFSVGLSRQHKGDHSRLEAALPLCDAFHRWARLGIDEEHRWPGSQT